eukprot:4325241-Prymnesium_polylepis.1
MGHRGDLRTSCCGAHTATHGPKCMPLVRSCSERAGGRAATLKCHSPTRCEMLRGGVVPLRAKDHA